MQRVKGTILALLAVALLAGCYRRTWWCLSDDDCAPGFLCSKMTRMCEPASGSMDLSTAASDLNSQCRADADCAGGMCRMGMCAPCTLHADCASQTCDVYQTTPWGKGKCMSKDALIYADNRNGGACTDGDGSMVSPVCSIASAIAKLGGAKTAIRVMASTQSYGPITLMAGIVALYGPAGQGGKAIISQTGADAILVATGSLRADGFEINNSGTGLNCGGGNGVVATLHRCQIDSTTTAVISRNNCILELDRVLIDNNKIALYLHSNEDFIVTNNFIINNTWDQSPIDITGSGTFTFNTIALNRVFGQAGIQCGAGVLIDASIVVLNSASMNTQFSGTCSLGIFTVIGSMDTSTGGVKQDPVFRNVADSVSGTTIAYGLDPTKIVNQMYLIGKVPGGTDHDYFGNIRNPKGGANAIGAHEAK